MLEGQSVTCVEPKGSHILPHAKVPLCQDMGHFHEEKDNVDTWCSRQNHLASRCEALSSAKVTLPQSKTLVKHLAHELPLPRDLHPLFLFRNCNSHAGILFRHVISR